jgi:hypothetical protein
MRHTAEASPAVWQRHESLPEPAKCVAHGVGLDAETRRSLNHFAFMRPDSGVGPQASNLLDSAGPGAPCNSIREEFESGNRPRR